MGCNFLLGSVRRGCKVPRLDDADEVVLGRWVEEGPALLVAEARRTVSVLVTGGARHTSVVIMAASCRRLVIP